jgi:Tfp pilus assembly protein PilF
LAGLKVKRELLAQVKQVLSGTRELFVSHSLSFHQLEELFNHPEKLDQYLCWEGRAAKVLSQDGIFALIKVQLETRPLSGIGLLAKKAKLFNPEKIAALLRCNLTSIAACFNAENGNAAEFATVLELLKVNSSFDLQQTFIKELVSGEKHDQSWACWALDFFRQHDPAQPWFHEAAGDFNTQYAVHDEAVRAYQAAVKLEPKDKALQQKLKAAEKAFKAEKKEAEETRERWRKSVIALWSKAGLDEAAKVRLFEVLRQRPVAEISTLLESDQVINKSSELAILRTAILEEQAAGQGASELAELCRYHANRHFTELVTKVAKGNAVNQEGYVLLDQYLRKDWLELGHGRLSRNSLESLGGQKELVWAKLIARGHINERGDLLEFDGVRRHFDLGAEVSAAATDAVFKALYHASYYPLVDKLADASQNKTHKHAELCSLIMYHLYGKHYAASEEAQKQSRYTEALEKLLICYSVYPKEAEAARNIAIMLGMEAAGRQERGDLDGAVELFLQALYYDENSLVALERLALLTLNQGDYAASAGYSQRITALPLSLAHNNPALKTELTKARQAAYGNLALAQLTIYVKGGSSEHLAKAAENIEAAIQLAPGNIRHHYNRAKIKMFQGETAAAAEWLNGYLSGPDADPQLLVDFTMLAIGKYGDSQDAKEQEILRPLLGKLTDHLAAALAVNERLRTAYPTMLVDFAVNAEQIGLKEESERLIAAIMQYAAHDSGAYNYCLTTLARADARAGRNTEAADKLLRVINSGAKLRIYEEQIAGFHSVRVYAAELLTSLYSLAAESDLKAGEAVMSRLLAEFPDSSVLWTCLGSFHDLQGRHADALASYEKALAADPRYLLARLNHLGTLLESGDRGERYQAGMTALRETVRECLQLGATNDKLLDRLRLAFAYKALLTLYGETPSPEIIEIFALILGSERSAEFAEAIQNALGSLEKQGKAIPPEIAALIPART